MKHPYIQSSFVAYLGYFLSVWQSQFSMVPYRKVSPVVLLMLWGKTPGLLWYWSRICSCFLAVKIQWRCSLSEWSEPHGCLGRPRASFHQNLVLQWRDHPFADSSMKPKQEEGLVPQSQCSPPCSPVSFLPKEEETAEQRVSFFGLGWNHVGSAPAWFTLSTMACLAQCASYGRNSMSAASSLVSSTAAEDEITIGNSESLTASDAEELVCSIEVLETPSLSLSSQANLAWIGWPCMSLSSASSTSGS